MNVGDWAVAMFLLQKVSDPLFRIIRRDEGGSANFERANAICDLTDDGLLCLIEQIGQLVIPVEGRLLLKEFAKRRQDLCFGEGIGHLFNESEKCYSFWDGEVHNGLDRHRGWPVTF